MANETYHDTEPCPAPACQSDEEAHLEHLAELIDVYRQARTGAYTGTAGVTTLNGRAVAL